MATFLQLVVVRGVACQTINVRNVRDVVNAFMQKGSIYK